MDSLMQAMHLIDKHSDKIPEGDYLEICNNLKKAYTTRTDPLLFFDYENIRICPDDGDLNIAYFYIDHYFERAIDTDGDFIQSQINYLENEISLHSPLQRISKSLRERVLRQYCTIGGVCLLYTLRAHELRRTSYAVFCLKKKKQQKQPQPQQLSVTLTYDTPPTITITHKHH